MNESRPFVEAWTAVWREHDAAAWRRLVDDSCVLRNPLAELRPQDLGDYMENLQARITNHQLRPLRWGETADGVLIEWVMTGELPSGPVEIHGADRFTLTNGRAIYGVAYFDPRPLLNMPPAEE